VWVSTNRNQTQQWPHNFTNPIKIRTVQVETASLYTNPITITSSNNSQASTSNNDVVAYGAQTYSQHLSLHWPPLSPPKESPRRRATSDSGQLRIRALTGWLRARRSTRFWESAPSHPARKSRRRTGGWRGFATLTWCRWSEGIPLRQSLWRSTPHTARYRILRSGPVMIEACSGGASGR